MFYLATAVPDVITFGQVHGYFPAGLFTSIIYKIQTTLDSLNLLLCLVLCNIGFFSLMKFHLLEKVFFVAVSSMEILNLKVQ